MGIRINRSMGWYLPVEELPTDIGQWLELTNKSVPDHGSIIDVSCAWDLCRLVDDSDGSIKGVLFYPDIPTAKQWYRYDDDIDYAAATIRLNKDGEDLLDTRIIESPYPFYPWSGSYTDTDGEPLSDMDMALNHDIEKIPAIPPPIRYWVKFLKAGDDEMINKMRPVIAQWWT